MSKIDEFVEKAHSSNFLDVENVSDFAEKFEKSFKEVYGEKVTKEDCKEDDGIAVVPSWIKFDDEEVNKFGLLSISVDDRGEVLGGDVWEDGEWKEIDKSLKYCLLVEVEGDIHQDLQYKVD